MIIEDKPLPIDRPACVITRAMTRNVAQDPENMCDLFDTCVGHEFGKEEVLSKMLREPTEECGGSSGPQSEGG